MRNAIKPLARSVLMSLELTTVTSATDVAIQKKTFGQGMTMPIISIE